MEEAQMLMRLGWEKKFASLADQERKEKLKNFTSAIATRKI